MCFVASVHKNSTAGLHAFYPRHFQEVKISPHRYLGVKLVIRKKNYFAIMDQIGIFKQRDKGSLEITVLPYVSVSLFLILWVCNIF